MTRNPSGFGYNFSQRMEQPVNDADIEDSPKAFARDNFNRMDQGCVVYLVNVILVLEDSGHLQQWSFLEDDPTCCNPGGCDQYGNEREQTFLPCFFCGSRLNTRRFIERVQRRATIYFLRR